MRVSQICRKSQLQGGSVNWTIFIVLQLVTLTVGVY